MLLGDLIEILAGVAAVVAVFILLGTGFAVLAAALVLFYLAQVYSAVKITLPKPKASWLVRQRGEGDGNDA